MKVKRNSRNGLFVLLATTPLVVFALYPALLHYLGRHREHYELFHGHNQLQPYMKLLLFAVLLPFAVFFVLRCVEKRKNRKAMETGAEAPAKIISVTPNGKKIKEGVNEYWGMEMEVEVSLPGKEPYRVSLDRYVYVMDIPRFQPGSRIRVMVHTAGNEDMYYLIPDGQ